MTANVPARIPHPIRTVFHHGLHLILHEVQQQASNDQQGEELPHALAHPVHNEEVWAYLWRFGYLYIGDGDTDMSFATDPGILRYACARFNDPHAAWDDGDPRRSDLVCASLRLAQLNGDVTADRARELKRPSTDVYVAPDLPIQYGLVIATQKLRQTKLPPAVC